MKIGILGSGLMGGKLGILFTRAGHDVVFSYARSEQRLKRLAREANGHARAGTPAEAVSDADAVLLAAHDARPLRIARYMGAGECPAYWSLTSAWYESTHNPPSTGVTYPKDQLASAVGRESDHRTVRVARSMAFRCPPGSAPSRRGSCL